MTINRIPTGRRLAEIEEQFETVPPAQFAAERLLRAELRAAQTALGRVQLERNRLEADNERLRAALVYIRDHDYRGQRYTAIDMVLDLRYRAASTLDRTSAAHEAA